MRRPCHFVIQAEIERRPAPKLTTSKPQIISNFNIFDAHTASRHQVSDSPHAEEPICTVVRADGAIAPLLLMKSK